MLTTGTHGRGLSGALLCALAGAVLMAGCGRSDDGDRPVRAAPAEQRTQESPPEQRTLEHPAETTEPAEPPAEPRPDVAETPRPDEAGDATASASERRRLERAGYDVIQSRIAGLHPAPRAALELPLKRGARLTVYVYGSAKQARAKAGELRPLARQAPKYVALAVAGATVYFALSEDAGAPLSRAEFDDVVTIAEGA